MSALKTRSPPPSDHVRGLSRYMLSAWQDPRGRLLCHADGLQFRLHNPTEKAGLRRTPRLWGSTKMERLGRPRKIWIIDSAPARRHLCGDPQARRRLVRGFNDAAEFAMSKPAPRSSANRPSASPPQGQQLDELGDVPAGPSIIIGNEFSTHGDPPVRARRRQVAQRQIGSSAPADHIRRRPVADLGKALRIPPTMSKSARSR